MTNFNLCIMNIQSFFWKTKYSLVLIIIYIISSILQKFPNSELLLVGNSNSLVNE